MNSHVAVPIAAFAVGIPALILVTLGYSGTDIYGWLGSFAVYGFLTIYGLTCIALPLKLKRQGALSMTLLVIAVLAGMSMVMALAGTLYPVPAPPYSWLPYLYVPLTYSSPWSSFSATGTRATPW